MEPESDLHGFGIGPATPSIFEACHDPKNRKFLQNIKDESILRPFK